MANAREIRNRIRSIEDTKKITSAMYMISTTKLRKTRRDLEQTRPYFDNLKREMSLIFDRVPDLYHRYVQRDDRDKTTDLRIGCLVVTSDRGLAGAYNHNILKLVSDYLTAQQYLQRRVQMELYVAGEYGRQYLLKREANVDPNFLFSARDPNMGRARDISTYHFERFDDGRIDEIHIIYADMHRAGSTEVIEHQLLPIDPDFFTGDIEDEMTGEEKEFFPSVESVLEALVPSYVTGYVYSALVDSFCSEQSARMMAMDAAGRNADEMLEKLSMQYNRVRQAAITQEITEVAAGAKAQKRKKSMSKGAMV